MNKNLKNYVFWIFSELFINIIQSFDCEILSSDFE